MLDVQKSKLSKKIHHFYKFFFRPWLKIFSCCCKNCVLRVHRNILSKMFLKNIEKSSFWVLSNSFFVGVAKTAFYESRGTFWLQAFLEISREVHIFLAIELHFFGPRSQTALYMSTGTFWPRSFEDLKQHLQKFSSSQLWTHCDVLKIFRVQCGVVVSTLFYKRNWSSAWTYNCKIYGQKNLIIIKPACSTHCWNSNLNALIFFHKILLFAR